MKLRIFICILFSILTIQGLQAQSFYDTSYHNNGKIHSYGSFDKEMKCPVKYHYYYNGNVSFIEQYDSVSFTNEYILKAFNINGTPAILHSSKHGAPYGLFEEYYPDGQLKRVGYYYNGYRTGTWKDYYPNGKLSAVYSYRLSKADSTGERDLSWMNRDSLNILYYHFELGAADPSLGEYLQFINITKFDLAYLASTPSGVWITYDKRGKQTSKKNMITVKVNTQNKSN